MGPLIFLLTTCAVVPLGAQVLRVTRLAPTRVPERFLCSAATGYVILAYLVLGVGLIGHLTPWAVAVIIAACALAGLGNWYLLWESALQALSALLRALRSRHYLLGTSVLLLIVGLTFITALAPPASRDYDGLAEHLAQPATYIRHHRIEPLWYDHHSEFPATLQMLYTVGLLYGSISAAELFHWFYGLMALVAAALIARRFMARGATGWAAYVLATTPVFIMLSGMAYVDLGLVAYALLALLALLHWRQSRRNSDLILAGLLAGCGMTVKMQGIAIYGILMLAALVLLWPRAAAESEGEEPASHRRLALSTGLVTGQAAALPSTRPRRLGLWLAACLVGILIAFPWYLKSYLITGNPVYPFAYSIFGGKHWSAHRAQEYTGSQMAFGWGAMPSPQELAKLPGWERHFVGPRAPLKWLVAPFALTFLPWKFSVFLGNLPNILLTSIGPLYLALLGVLLLMPGRPRAVGLSLWIFLPLWLWWFVSMQLGRYLLPSLALLAPAAGYAAYRCMRGGQVMRPFMAWSAGLWTIVPVGVALTLVIPELPVVLGIQSRQQYLLQNLDIYAPSLYISQHTPPDARVATYGEVRCFYFNRDCLWADSGHSDLIPYKRMHGPRDLVRWYHKLGITYVLFNTANMPGLWTAKTGELKLLREAVDQGYLAPVTDFPNPDLQLFIVRQSP